MVAHVVRHTKCLQVKLYCWGVVRIKGRKKTPRELAELMSVPKFCAANCFSVTADSVAALKYSAILVMLTFEGLSP